MSKNKKQKVEPAPTPAPPQKWKKTRNLYATPLSKGYWRDALLEVKDPRMLVVAALMIALRVAMKPLSIPLAPNLRINTAFVANALGAMIFGPVMAALCACVTDVLGYLVFPDGVYFLPFILTEIAGSVIFALFLYRAKVTPLRVMLSRFCICFFVNILLQTPIMIWYNQVMLGGKAYVLTVPSILKNLFMFPLESVVLTLFLSVLMPITTRLGLTYGSTTDVKAGLKFSKAHIVTLFALFFVGAACVVGYLNYYYQITSLSASYTAEERPEKNREMLEFVLEKTDDWDDEADAVVTVIESAYHPFLSSDTTYTVAIYTVDTEALAQTDRNMDTLWAYSKSKAASDETMSRAGDATIVVREKTGEILDFSIRYTK